MARDIIKLDEVEKPEFTKSQEGLCEKLIGMGLTRTSIVAIILGKDTSALNHAEVGTGYRLIERKRKELGYGIADARRAASPWMAAAVQAAAAKHRIRIKIA